MATIIKTIGTTGRDFTTIAAWIAAIPADLVAVSELWEGQTFADSSFNEANVISGHTVNSSFFIRLTTGAGQRHNGTSTGGGVVIDRAGGTGAVLDLNDSFTEVLGLRITGMGVSAGSSGIAINAGTSILIDGCIIHDGDIRGIIANGTTVDTCRAQNVLIYDITNSHGINVRNNAELTCDNVVCHNGGSNGFSRDPSVGGFLKCRNCVATDNTGSDYSGTFDAASDRNFASDLTAPGTNPTNSILASNNFKVLTQGSEDFHKKDSAADIHDGGGNLTSDFTNDIDEETRPATGAWDAGVDEEVAVPADIDLHTYGRGMSRGFSGGFE